jgi:hypothetical protein
MLKAMEKLRIGISRMIFWGYVPYINTSLATNQGSPPKLLYHMMTHTEEAEANKNDILGAFLDNEGAFDNT